MNDIPRMLGDRYEVGDVLGRGGMAEVHEGRDTRLGRRVAVKMLRSDLARDPVFQARFRREAQSSAGLNHPAIVAVYDTGEDVFVESGGAHVRLPYIVMEYVEGRTVRDLLVAAGGHGLGTERSVTITSGVLTALDYSHRQGIVHRDIKPANVMITPTGGIKVIAFVIARALADTSATMTATSAVIGTAQYLSPEQARGETVDARSDLYSAGCLLYELLTGRPPFVGDSPVSVAYQHVREVPQPPSTLNPAVDDEMDRVVLKALAKDRDDRYDDAEQFRADLVAAEHGLPVSAPTVALATAAATQALPTTTEATRALAASGIAATAATAALPADARPGSRRSAAAAAAAAEEAEQPRRRRTGLVVGLVLLGLLVVAAVAYGLVRASGPDQVTVPEVTATNVVEAQSQLEALGLAVETEEAPAEEAVGTVVDQDPAARTEVDEGSTVTLTVSTGPEAVAVPDVAGQTESQARLALQRAGFQDGDVTEESNADVEQGRVIRTDPAANAEVAPGATVNLVVSSGELELPDVVGTPVEEAQAQLEELGFDVSTSTEPSAEPEGTVLSQTPEAGSVEAGTRVRLVAAVPLPATPTATPTPTETPTDEGDGGDEEEGDEEQSTAPTPPGEGQANGPVNGLGVGNGGGGNGGGNGGGGKKG